MGIKSVGRRMPKFVFKAGNVEPETFSFPDLATAKCEAMRYAGRLICAQAETFWEHGNFEMTVTDEKNLTLFTLIMAGTESAAIPGMLSARQ